MKKETAIEFAHKLARAYSDRCKPLCRRLNMPQTAFDILLFLANNPKYDTARDIVEVRGLKANLVSMNADRLVNEGYLERLPSPNDRRKTILRLTEKAEPVIEQGRLLQSEFFGELFSGVSEEEKNAFFRVADMMSANAENMNGELDAKEK